MPHTWRRGRANAGISNHRKTATKGKRGGKAKERERAGTNKSLRKILPSRMQRIARSNRFGVDFRGLLQRYKPNVKMGVKEKRYKAVSHGRGDEKVEKSH